MRYLFRGTIAAIALAGTLLFASAAWAAPAAWQSVDVTLQDGQPSPILLVSGTLPTSAKLPADVQLEVPSGTQFQWAGEILGGPASQDPTVKYTVSTKNGMDIYSFTLTKVRTGQIEVALPGAVQSDGTQFATALKWVATQDVPVVNISARIPQNAQITQSAEGAQTIPGPTGYAYYQKSVNNVSAGDQLELSFAYTAAAGGGATSGAAGGTAGSNPGVPLAIVAAVFAVAIFFAARAISRKAQLARGDEEEDEDADDEEYEDDDYEGVEETDYFDDDDEEVPAKRR